MQLTANTVFVDVLEIHPLMVNRFDIGVSAIAANPTCKAVFFDFVSENRSPRQRISQPLESQTSSRMGTLLLELLKRIHATAVHCFD